MDRKFRAARVWSNKILRKYAPFFEGDICNVSAWIDIDKEGGQYKDYFAGASSYSVTNYGAKEGHESHKGSYGKDGDKNVKEYILDLTSPTLPENLRKKFNVVMNHTVLEHIYDNHTAFKNICDMSSEVVISIVPWVQEVHVAPDGAYNDYWRYSPYAMSELYKENGYTMVVCEYNNDFDTAVYLFTIGIRDECLNLQKYNMFKKMIINNDNPAGRWIGEKIKLSDLLSTRIR